MIISPYQVVAPLISLIAVLYAWNLVVRQRKTIWEASLWSLFWIGIAVIAVYPAAIDYLKIFTGIQDRENAVLVTFLGILSFIVFSLVVRLEEVNQRQTRFVRQLALREAGLTDEKPLEPKKP